MWLEVAVRENSCIQRGVVLSGNDSWWACFPRVQMIPFLLSMCSSLTILVLLVILDTTELIGASWGGKAPGLKAALRRV